MFELALGFSGWRRSTVALNESYVVFTLIAKRYERRSMLITSNPLFSDWEHILKDPMATATAIDRLVHHATILEFNVPSYRTRKGRRSQ